MIPLFDLHCDTVGKMYKEGFQLSSSPLHISLDKCKDILPYAQVMAIWSDYRLTPDEAFEFYSSAVSYANMQGIQFTRDKSGFCERRYILAVEDAKILNNDISRLDTLYNDGVRVLTLCWRDESCIGGGWNTALPLTPFGRQVVLRCLELGIIPDISHSSLPIIKEVTSIAAECNKTVIASHSNSFSVCKHQRNLTDVDFISIKELEGIVGISLCPQHLAKNGSADITHIVRHIEHYLSLGGENTVCLGCDLDGIDSLPTGIKDISSMPFLYSELSSYFGQDITDKIFYHNAYRYFNKNL